MRQKSSRKPNRRQQRSLPQRPRLRNLRQSRRRKPQLSSRRHRQRKRRKRRNARNLRRLRSWKSTTRLSFSTTIFRKMVSAVTCTATISTEMTSVITAMTLTQVETTTDHLHQSERKKRSRQAKVVNRKRRRSLNQANHQTMGFLVGLDTDSEPPPFALCSPLWSA